MNLRDLPAYQSKYLHHSDLLGRMVKAVIERVTVEEFYNQQTRQTDQNGVLWFTGKQKGLVINKTRLGQLETIFGSSNTDDWLGHAVMLSPTKQRGKDTIFINPSSNGEQR